MIYTLDYCFFGIFILRAGLFSERLGIRAWVNVLCLMHVV